MRRRPTATSAVPVIALGGSDNTLSVARSLGRRGVRVLSVAASDPTITASRHLAAVDAAPGLDLGTTAELLLLGDRPLEPGALVLAMSDEAIVFVADRRAELAERYLLDLSNPVAAHTMLDKRSTYEAARRAGVETPRFWPVDDPDEIDSIADELVYPLVVKPTHSHLFQARFGRKFDVAETLDEVRPALERIDEAGTTALLVERIPGPDTRLRSYYSYLDESGTACFDFTKRIVRRHPPGMGLATYHATDRIDGIREPALALAAEVGLLGLLNVEFKLDSRDGRNKLIECNARFTAGDPLVARAGVDLAGYVYARATGTPLPEIDGFRSGLTMWDPIRDWAAHSALRAAGEESHVDWIRSIARRHAAHPTLSLRDPAPALARLRRQLAER